ncbi:MAG: hypothetical protein WDW38_008820 [Sanguina aurantia]
MRPSDTVVDVTIPRAELGSKVYPWNLNFSVSKSVVDRLADTSRLGQGCRCISDAHADHLFPASLPPSPPHPTGTPRDATLRAVCFCACNIPLAPTCTTELPCERVRVTQIAAPPATSRVPLHLSRPPPPLASPCTSRVPLHLSPPRHLSRPSAPLASLCTCRVPRHLSRPSAPLASLCTSRVPRHLSRPSAPPASPCTSRVPLHLSRPSPCPPFTPRPEAARLGSHLPG